MDENLHSPQRRLVEPRMTQADLGRAADRVARERSIDFTARGLQQRCLPLSDQLGHGPALV